MGEKQQAAMATQQMRVMARQIEMQVRARARAVCAHHIYRARLPEALANHIITRFTGAAE